MRHLTTNLGGAPVTIYAPRPGTLDAPRIRESIIPPNSLTGLDVESTYMSAKGPWDPNYRLRSVQFGSWDEAVFLRMDDPAQRDMVAELCDPAGGREFTSHTQIDTIALNVVLGIDVTARNLDSHWLSIMSSADDKKGGADLKTQARLHGMPELKNADARLDDLFDSMYRAAHPEHGRRAIKATDLAEFGFNNVDLDHPVFWAYGGLDAISVRRLAERLLEQVAAPVHLLRTERFLSRECTRIRLHGHRVDVEALDDLQPKVQAEVDEVTSIITEHTGGLKPTQTVKLVEWFGQHGADWSEHPRTAASKSHPNGQVTLAKEAGPLLLTYPLDDAGRTVAEAYLRHAKVLDRFRRTQAIRDGMVLHGPNNWRVHPTLLSIGTVTSRMSSTGINFQNFAKKDTAMRGLLLPDEGHVLISCDFDQVEIRGMAALAVETVLIEAIKDGADLHKLTAALLTIERQEAKTVNFLIGYGGQAKRLRAQLNYSRSLAECERIVREYWEKYPRISALNDELRNLVHTVRLISGRQVAVGRYPNGGAAVHANLNRLVQGSCRELLAGAWRRWNRPVWMAIHDELVVQAPEDRSVEYAARLRECMTFDFMGVPITAGVDLLIDDQGVSRWMSGDAAVAYAKGRAA